MLPHQQWLCYMVYWAGCQLRGSRKSSPAVFAHLVASESFQLHLFWPMEHDQNGELQNGLTRQHGFTLRMRSAVSLETFPSIRSPSTRSSYLNGPPSPSGHNRFHHKCVPLRAASNITNIAGVADESRFGAMRAEVGSDTTFKAKFHPLLSPGSSPPRISLFVGTKPLTAIALYTSLSCASHMKTAT